MTTHVLVCGSHDRGDDAAALAVVDLIDPADRAAVQVDLVGELRVEDLVDLAPDDAVIVVDAAVGLAPGVVRTLSFAALRDDARSPIPRSSHELPIPEVVGIAELLAGPLRGSVVVMGGADFSFGAPLTPAVAAAMPAFAHELGHAIADLA